MIRDRWGAKFGSVETTTTCLHDAVIAGDYLMATRWIDEGADVNARSRSSRDPSITSAYTRACRRGNLEMMALLRRRGANPNESWPLHSILFEDYIPGWFYVARDLLYSGTKIDAVGPDNKTALERIAGFDAWSSTLSHRIEFLMVMGANGDLPFHSPAPPPLSATALFTQVIRQCEARDPTAKRRARLQLPFVLRWLWVIRVADHLPPLPRDIVRTIVGWIESAPYPQPWL
jgi:hypothetical protein